MIRFALLRLVFAVATCSTSAIHLSRGAEIASAPLAPASPEGDRLFTALDQEATGIDFSNPIDEAQPT